MESNLTEKFLSKGDTRDFACSVESMHVKQYFSVDWIFKIHTEFPLQTITQNVFLTLFRVMKVEIRTAVLIYESNINRWACIFVEWIRLCSLIVLALLSLQICRIKII